MKKLTVGFIAGLLIGMPAMGHADGAWKRYKGLQTGEVIVCKKTKGHLAIEKDLTRNKKYAVAHCNGKNWGRK